VEVRLLLAKDWSLLIRHRGAISKEKFGVWLFEGRTGIPGFCGTTHTFENPSHSLPQGHPFGASETFVPAIATDLSEAYNTTLRLKSIAQVVLPCHGPGYDDRTKRYL